ncbi:MAG: D-alanyl-D-alanine carboxypeptidase family protein [Paracoccaceae bacterium]
MDKRLGQIARFGLFLLALTVLALLPPLKAHSAPYAAMVIDARSGEVLHSRNADTRLHPASLTKMMTLYIAFEAIRKGEITLEKKITISKKAANEPPSKLGLRAGQVIQFRYLIRAASVKSANDAATAIGEAISGSEAAFARRMTRTAKALGMNRTTFKNAHGLTEAGHLSTARDMTTMGRRLFYDYPQYYNLFSRMSTDAGMKTVKNTNRRFLGSYRGADGIKTGYTRAAGFNLVASAERGNERIITTVFGGTSSAARNAKVQELMNMGFRRAPTRARVKKPALPTYANLAPEPVDPNDGKKMSLGKTLRVKMTIKKSVIPLLRPSQEPAGPTEEVLLAMAADIQNALQETQAADIRNALLEAQKTPAEPEEVIIAEVVPEPKPVPKPVVIAKAPILTTTPLTQPDNVVLASLSTQTVTTSPEIVTRISTSGGRHWGINVGNYNTRYEAERVLLKTALKELGTLDEALRKVVHSDRGFEANFVGMSEDMAALACRRLSARSVDCTTLGPG